MQQPKRDLQWHLDDCADELAEYQEATKSIHKWSELSDVVYTVTRSRWSGHDMDFPFGKAQYYVGMVYMFPKYSLRDWFFRSAGKKVDSKRPIRQVRNPKKVHKLQFIANKYDVNADEFVKICHKQLKYWPLLP